MNRDDGNTEPVVVATGPLTVEELEDLHDTLIDLRMRFRSEALAESVTFENVEVLVRRHEVLGKHRDRLTARIQELRNPCR